MICAAAVTKRMRRCKTPLFKKKNRKFCAEAKKKMSGKIKCCEFRMVPEERDDSDDDDSRQRPQPIVTTTPELPECSDDSSEDGRSEDSSDRSGWGWPRNPGRRSSDDSESSDGADSDVSRSQSRDSDRSQSEDSGSNDRDRGGWRGRSGGRGRESGSSESD